MCGYFQQGRSALPHAQQVRIVGGFNGWRHELFDFVLKPRPNAPEVRNQASRLKTTWTLFP